MRSASSACLERLGGHSRVRNRFACAALNWTSTFSHYRPAQGEIHVVRRRATRAISCRRPMTRLIRKGGDGVGWGSLPAVVRSADVVRGSSWPMQPWQVLIQRCGWPQESGKSRNPGHALSVLRHGDRHLSAPQRGPSSCNAHSVVVPEGLDHTPDSRSECPAPTASEPASLMARMVRLINPRRLRKARRAASLSSRW